MKVWLEIFFAALRLGLTSFGGPVAHLGYFHREYVVRRRWLDEGAYADLVALCQALPGPTSSQVGMAIGSSRGGPAGAVAAWLGFTLPSALVMAGFGFLWTLRAEIPGFPGLIHGLGLVAVAVVAQAVWLMGRQLITTPAAAGLAAAMLVGSALVPSPLTPLVGLVLAGIAGLGLFRQTASPSSQSHSQGIREAIFWLLLLVLLLISLPLVRLLDDSKLVLLVDALSRTGSLVFGGGHVVLPLLESELVGPDLIDQEAFLAGYGLAQAVPGPLFALSAYLGFLVAGGGGAALALVAMFLPALLLVLGILPLWSGLKQRGWFRRALGGVNAAVVGLLAWAWYDPVLTTAVKQPLDGLIAVALCLALMLGRFPPWLVVLAGSVAGLGLEFLAR